MGDEEARNRADYLALRAGRLPPSVLDRGVIVVPPYDPTVPLTRPRRPRMPINQRVKQAVLRSRLARPVLGALGIIALLLGRRARRGFERLLQVRGQSRLAARRQARSWRRRREAFAVLAAEEDGRAARPPR